MIASMYNPMPLTAGAALPHLCRSCGAELKLVEKTITHEGRRGRRAGRPPTKMMVWAHVAPRPKKTRARRS